MVADPSRWPEWWPGLVEAEPTVRRALAPGALWNVEGTNRSSLFRRGPQLGGTLLVLDVVVQKRVAFLLTSERTDVELDLSPAEDGETQAWLALEAPRFGGIGRTVPSQALARLAALVRPGAR